MSSKLDLTKEDLYGILGVDEDATEKQILKSYRKQALKCHPDKNPDNPAAADQFHKLTEALEVLTDAAAKSAYDKILKAKKAAALRHKQYDSKRKKFKEDLEARESAAGQSKEDEVTAARTLQAEIDRLRKEGNKILEEAQEQLRRDLEEKLNQKDEDNVDSEDDSATAKIKAKWKIGKGENRDEGYTKEELTDMFSKYGDVLNIVLSIKKSGTAIIEFASPCTAELAVETVSGKPDFPLTLSWLSGEPPKQSLGTERNNQESQADNRTSYLSTSNNPAHYQSAYTSPAPPDSRDFESIVLMKMRQAEERKRLIQQMMKEEEEGAT